MALSTICLPEQMQQISRDYIQTFNSPVVFYDTDSYYKINTSNDLNKTINLPPIIIDKVIVALMSQWGGKRNDGSCYSRRLIKNASFLIIKPIRKMS
jgi:hypothetical protein